MKKNQLFAFVFVFGLCFLKCGFNINTTIHINDGEIRRGNLGTINGSVIVGSDCEVAGSCWTVNGVIKVGANSTVRNMMAVNGSISVAENAHIRGTVTAVNGALSCDSGVKVEKKVVSINGDIELKKTEVGQKVQTTNGNVLLSDGTVVSGDVVVTDNKHSSGWDKPVRIRITTGSVVKGDVISESDDREVELILSSGGQVLGDVIDVQVIQE